MTAATDSRAGKEKGCGVGAKKVRLEATSAAEYQAVYEEKGEFQARHPNARRSAPRTIEDLVQQQMIRGLQN
jgi:hypothetical protein